MSDKCGGGTRRIKYSECSNGTCCQLKSTWKFYPSVESCKTAQDQEAPQPASTFKIEIPNGEEKECRVEGYEDINTYIKLMTQYLHDFNETDIESCLTQAIEYKKILRGNCQILHPLDVFIGLF